MAADESSTRVAQLLPEKVVSSDNGAPGAAQAAGRVRDAGEPFGAEIRGLEFVNPDIRKVVQLGDAADGVVQCFLERPAQFVDGGRVGG